jgi:hypothetical protein
MDHDNTTEATENADCGEDDSLPAVTSNEEEEYEARLDYELKVIWKMRVAYASCLYMLESTRDDLVEMGNRMDRLRNVSELCRKALTEKKTSASAAPNHEEIAGNK